MAEPATALGLDERELDEYAVAQRGPVSWPDRWLIIVVAVGLGAVIVMGLSAARRDARAQDARAAELVTIVREQKAEVDALAESLRELSAQVAEQERAVSAGVPALDAALREAERRAGLTAVRGPGVVVTLFDAPPSCTGPVYLCRVQDFDLQQTVNALFASGAEAVAVDDQRLAATTAIRAAGGQITANYRYLTSPYELRAVGDPQLLLAGLGRQDLEGAFRGAGSDLSVEVRTSDEVAVPALTAAPAVRVARPQPSAPATGAVGMAPVELP